MGWKRALAIYTVTQAQQQAQQQQQQQQAQGQAQNATQTGEVQQTTPAYNIGGETTTYNAGLLSYKKGKKEASQKLGTQNFASIDEHQGQVLLG